MNWMNWQKLAKKYNKNCSWDFFVDGDKSFMIYKSDKVGLHCYINKYGTFWSVTTKDGVHSFNTELEAVNFFERKSQHELS